MASPALREKPLSEVTPRQGIKLTDVLMIGGGLAGERCAIEAASRGLDVVLLSLVPPRRGHSCSAQGGMQAALANCANAENAYAIDGAVVCLGVEVWDWAEALQLIHEGGRCWGAVVRNLRDGGLSAVLATATIVATGGHGRIYGAYTTNAEINEGTGTALALQAGVPVGNMEAVQFRPTGLVRGDGGFLLDRDLHDPAKDPIPVRPTQHYSMGGIRVNKEGQAYGMKGLFAVGEAACWDLHGFNRLGSNSLAETIVAGRLIGRYVAAFAHRESLSVELQIASRFVADTEKRIQEWLDRSGGGPSVYAIRDAARSYDTS